MSYSRSVEITFEWIGFHCWPEAPESHAFLRERHRHKFFGTARIEVGHNNREVEYFRVLEYITPVLEEYKELNAGSCEHVAQDLLEYLLREYGDRRRVSVSVFEDNENGSTVTWTPDRMGVA